MKVIKHVSIVFSIRKYSFEVICDVVLMHTNHLHGSFYQMAIHYRFGNRIGMAIPSTLLPLSPKQVYDNLHDRDLVFEIGGFESRL